MQVRSFAQRCFRLQDEPLEALERVLPTVIHSLLPVLLAGFLAAAVAGVIQTKGLYNLELLALKPDRLNPIPKLKSHVAIALRYDADPTPAPVVIAKGVEEMTLEMRAEARSHGIPVVENRPLARTLLKTSKVGQTIPVDLYKAVAEVIAHIMRIR